MGVDALDLERTLKLLAIERPVFYSEADFQHALAWKIHEQYSNSRIRLEVPSGNFDKRERIDIIAYDNGQKYAIELKYKKKRLTVVVDGETFALSDDGAQDISRYDVFKDIVRLERYVAAADNTTGYAIFLTNDDLYWRESSRGINSAAFFLHEARRVDAGTAYAWHERTGDGTRKGREQALTIRTSYTLRWNDYSRVSEQPQARFRYLLLHVRKMCLGVGAVLDPPSHRRLTNPLWRSRIV